MQKSRFRVPEERLEGYGRHGQFGFELNQSQTEAVKAASVLLYESHAIITTDCTRAIERLRVLRACDCVYDPQSVCVF